MDGGSLVPSVGGAVLRCWARGMPKTHFLGAEACSQACPLFGSYLLSQNYRNYWIKVVRVVPNTSTSTQEHYHINHINHINHIINRQLYAIN